MKNVWRFLTVAMLWLSGTVLTAAERQVLPAHVLQAVAKLQPIARLASSSRLNLAISLPLRDQEGLKNFLRQVSDPTSPVFRHYLTPGQFTERFGPSREAYQAVVDFLKSQGLTVTGTHSNRAIVDVVGPLTNIEAAFHVRLNVYKHPFEARTFYAPDAEPSVDTTVPILEVIGLDNYTLPRPMYHAPLNKIAKKMDAKPNFGSGPNGTLMGNDFRAAYLPGVTLTGAGQTIGLFEIGGYYTNDIVQYANDAGLTNTSLISNVFVEGNGIPGAYNTEVALDIEMAMSMAPGAHILVYQSNGGILDVLERMISDNSAKQIGCSWAIGWGLTADNLYQQMAAQGQTFFNASGDNGAYTSESDIPVDDPYVTTVGGTTLTTDTNGSWVSETAWNWVTTGEGTDSTGGGPSAILPIPTWQEGINMTYNGGSATSRNLPDVAMVADYIYVVVNNGQQEWLGGTSFSTPLWAAFTALVNQQAAAQGRQPVGFLNPVLYALGENAANRAYFHDIVSGGSTNSTDPTNYFAVPGYDLCTGWGSPQTNLIAALVNFPNLSPMNSNPQTIHVPADYPTIQAAINAASFVTNNTVLVSPGVYNEAINFGGKPVLLISADGPTVTIINPPAGAVAITFNSGETSNSILSGFTITNGGISISFGSPMIVSNNFVNCGTAISSSYGYPTIEDNNIIGSTGNGIYLYAVAFGTAIVSGNTIIGCTNNGIYLNTASSGPSVIQGNIIENNAGSGIALYSSGATTIVNNTILNNEQDGILNDFSSPDIIQNIIANNVESGIYNQSVLDQSVFEFRGPWMINNTIAGNGGPGIWMDDFSASDCEIYNNTVVGSPALDLYPMNSWPGYVIKFNDFYSSAGNAYLSSDVGSPGSIVFDLNLTDNAYINSNFTANPFFVCPSSDFHLVTGSPCIAAGTDLAPLFPALDFDGHARNHGVNPNHVADLGAYEYNSAAPPTPCLYLNCPSDIVTTAVPGQNSAVVNYPAPDATPDATVTCAPVSGSVFPAGTNVVVCTLVSGTNVITGTFTVTVLIAPYITNQPSIISVLANSNAMITVGVIGTPPLDFQWSFNGSVIANTINSTLIVSNAQSINEGIYSVTISGNSGSVTSLNIFLRVIPAGAAVVSGPVSLSVFAGNQATFNPTVIGSAPLYFQWYKDGAMLAGDNSPQLVIPNAQAADAGQYQLLVSNILRTAVSPAATLTVVPAKPSFTLQPVAASGWPGDGVTFESQAVGSDDGLDPIVYNWYFQSNAIPGQTGAALSLAAIAPTNQGAYFVVASNNYGASTSVVVQLTVFQAPSLVAGLSNLVVDAGKTIVLNPSASGTPPLSYSWTFNFSQLTNTGPLLVSANVSPSQSGFYSVTITNQFGAISSVGRVSVFMPESQIMAWGDDSGGQIDVPTNLYDAVAVAGGEYHSVAIRHDGSLIAWGMDDEGQIDVPTNSLPFVAVTAGADHNLAIAEDGSVVAWGLDDSGQIDVPTSVSSVLSVAAGDSHSLALLMSGVVIPWGDNTYGQTTLPNQLLTGSWGGVWWNPTWIPNPNWLPAEAIAAGSDHSLALLTNGLVVAWGDNSFGQATPPSNLSNVVAITAGYLHSVALCSNGTVVAWGDDSFGQTNVPAGLSNVVAIAAGDFHTLALLSNGSIVGWGNDSLGQLDTPAGVKDAVGIASGYYTGMALVPFKAYLQAKMTSAGLLIRWNGTEVLQWAFTPEGPYFDLPSLGNSWTNSNMSAHAKFFRLRSQ